MNHTAKKSSKPESPTVFWVPPPSSGTSESSSATVTPKAIAAWLTSLQAASPVNHSASQGSDREPTTNATCGPTPSNAFARYDRDSHSWRTSQGYFIPVTLDESSETWPKAGMTCGGVCYRQPKWERRIAAIGSGLWPGVRASGNALDGGSNSRKAAKARGMWPTINVHGQHNRKGASPTSGNGLSTAVKMWPTPREFMHKDSKTNRGKCNLGEVVFDGGTPTQRTCLTAAAQSRGVGGTGNVNKMKDILGCETTGYLLNPDWVAWLMGWPIGWTDLKPLATDRFRRWLRLHGGF